MITHYFCKSITLGIEKCRFNQWHKHEIKNTKNECDSIVRARTVPAKLTLSEA